MTNSASTAPDPKWPSFARKHRPLRLQYRPDPGNFLPGSGQARVHLMAKTKAPRRFADPDYLCPLGMGRKVAPPATRIFLTEPATKASSQAADLLWLAYGWLERDHRHLKI